MNIVNPPAVADGGYWYAVQATKGSDGAWTVSVTGVGWCAWYADINSVKYAAIRTPQPVTNMATASVSVAAILAAAGYSTDPFGRIGGQ